MVVSMSAHIYKCQRGKFNSNFPRTGLLLFKSVHPVRWFLFGDISTEKSFWASGPGCKINAELQGFVYLSLGQRKWPGSNVIVLQSCQSDLPGTDSGPKEGGILFTGCSLWEGGSQGSDWRRELGLWVWTPRSRAWVGGVCDSVQVISLRRASVFSRGKWTDWKLVLASSDFLYVRSPVGNSGRGSGPRSRKESEQDLCCSDSAP